MFDNYLILPQSKKDIKVARIYLEMSQPELAKKVNCNAYTINSLETGKHKTRKELLEKIAEFFLTEGIKFLPNGGFSVDNNPIKIFSGKDCFLKIQKDMFSTFKNKNIPKEIFYLGTDEKKSTQKILLNDAKLYQMGIKFKNLIAENNEYFLGNIEDYRTLKNTILPDDIIVIYGNKLAFTIVENGIVNRALIINDKSIANSQKRLFNILWENGHKLQKTKSEISYKTLTK